MKGDHTTTSPYLTYTFLLGGWENVLFELGSERVNQIVTLVKRSLGLKPYYPPGIQDRGASTALLLLILCAYLMSSSDETTPYAKNITKIYKTNFKVIEFLHTTIFRNLPIQIS